MSSAASLLESTNVSTASSNSDSEVAKYSAHLRILSHRLPLGGILLRRSWLMKLRKASIVMPAASQSSLLDLSSSCSLCLSVCRESCTSPIISRLGGDGDFALLMTFLAFFSRPKLSSWAIVVSETMVAGMELTDILSASGLAGRGRDSRLLGASIDFEETDLPLTGVWVDEPGVWDLLRLERMDMSASVDCVEWASP